MDDRLVLKIKVLATAAVCACAPSHTTRETSPEVAVHEPKAPPREASPPEKATAEPTPVSFHVHANLRSPEGGVMGMLFSQRCVDAAKRRNLSFLKHEDRGAPKAPSAKIVVFLRGGDTCAPQWRPVVAKLGETSAKTEVECAAWKVTGCELFVTAVAVYGAWQTAKSWHELDWDRVDKDGIDPIDAIKVKVPGTQLVFHSRRKRDDEIRLGGTVIATIKSAATYPLVDGVPLLKYERGLAQLSDEGLTPVPLVGAVRQIPPPKVDDRGQN